MLKTSSPSTLTVSTAILLSVLGARIASAEPDEPSLAWQLRPATTRSLARGDTTAAVFTDPNGNVDIAGTTVLSGSYQRTERWAPMLRVGLVGNNAPGAALDGTTVGNPLAGAAYTRTAGHRRLALFAATTIPIGAGGGNMPDLRAAKANQASITARPADAALFEVNYLTEIAGGDITYTTHGVTAQAEATLQQSIRVRGERSADATDAARTRATLGAHLGTLLGTHVSVGADLRYQRWLTHPTQLDAMSGARVPIADADVATLAVTAGVRVHFRLGAHATIQPGLSFTRGLDDLRGSMITNRTTAVALDVPVLF